MSIKHTLQTFARRCGYDIRRISDKTAVGRLRTSIEESYLLLRELGFRPDIVIDVGVAKGTDDLYRTFPDSFFLLIEPLKEFEADLKRILVRHRGNYVLAAAASSTGLVTFNVHKNHLEGSSLYKETMGAAADGCEITVPTVRIDDIMKEKELTGSCLIKVDAQGAELNVLDGAQETLRMAEAVALEVSMFQFMKGAPQFFDVVLYMKNHGFVAYDIIHGWNRPLDNALGQLDIIFVQENGKFRHNHSYSTAEQMKKLTGSSFG
ncbi:MAG: FkbM family methyltransferase [Deltaproteobacteria bacterium]|nr:FkbM family methyltransferase [Deltaproteobacteria bacterium]